MRFRIQSYSLMPLQHCIFQTFTHPPTQQHQQLQQHHPTLATKFQHHVRLRISSKYQHHVSLRTWESITSGISSRGLLATCPESNGHMSSESTCVYMGKVIFKCDVFFLESPEHACQRRSPSRTSIPDTAHFHDQTSTPKQYHDQTSTPKQHHNQTSIPSSTSVCAHPVHTGGSPYFSATVSVASTPASAQNVPYLCIKCQATCVMTSGVHE